MFRININLIILICSVLYLVLNILCHPHNRNIYIDNTKKIIFNRSQKAIIIPIKDITVTYIDNTTLRSDSVFSDSFLIETANSLLEFECKKYFSLYKNQGKLMEYDTTISRIKKYQYSRLYEKNQDFNNISLGIKEITNILNIDYLIIPYSCEINHSSFQPEGWRNSPHYTRPVKYSVRTKTHLQIWNHEGVLIYERISSKKTGKPLLYSFLKKTDKHDDIVKYSKSYFAPPSLKSLSKAISSAMNIPLK